MSLRPAPWPLLGPNGSRRAAQKPATAPQPRPKLQLVDSVSAPRLEHFSARIRLIGLMGSVVAVLFGVVAFHVVLSQGQFRLDSLQNKADVQQEQYERLRLQVAQLESPARITSEAQNRLGMVTPDKVTPITPNKSDVSPGARTQPSTTPSGRPNTSAQPNTSTPSDTSMQSNPETTDPADWSAVKSHLSSPAQ